MRKPSSSSKSVIAARVAAAFGLTAGPALAQAMSHDNQSNTPASQRPASRKSVRHLTAQVKHEREQMQAAEGRLKSATAKLNRTAQRMKQAQRKDIRVASAERSVRKGERKTRSEVHSRKAAPASTTPPQR